MTVQLSSLRYSAEIDASKYTDGMAAKVAADKAGTASSETLSAAISSTDTKISRSGDILTQLQRKYKEGAKEAMTFNSELKRLGPRNEITIKGKRCVRFTAHKGRNRHPVEIEARLTDELIASIAATKVGTTAYVLSSRDAPYTIESFGNAFARWCEEAGLPHCSSHGLRKAAAVAYAESEGTAPELMAIFGWSNLRTAQIYIEQASKRRMRANAFDRREEYKKKENVSLLAVEKPNETNEEKSDEKTR